MSLILLPAVDVVEGGGLQVAAAAAGEHPRLRRMDAAQRGQHAPRGGLAVVALDVDVAEDAGSVAFEVIRHNGQAYSAGVRVFGQNGSASNGADFNIDAAGILASWGNGVDGALAKNVAILDDALAEGNESFSLVLGNFGTVLPGVVTTLTVNIIDDDSNDLIFANGFDP